MIWQANKGAPDWWDSARFQAVCVVQVGSVKVVLSRPAHQRVTLAVRPHDFFLEVGPRAK